MTDSDDQQQPSPDAPTDTAVVVPPDPEADAVVEEATSDRRAFEDAVEDFDLPSGRHALRADRIDAERDAGGAAAAASGRDDVGPGSGL